MGKEGIHMFLGVLLLHVLVKPQDMVEGCQSLTPNRLYSTIEGR